MGTETPLTKRTILGKVSSVFDNMGLFSPIMITGKMLLQDLWAREFDLDDPVPTPRKRLWFRGKVSVF